MKKVEIKTWTEATYQEYIQYLISLKEEPYKQFQSRLIPTKYEILGIRFPMLRKIAKEISKGDSSSFLKVSKQNYFEDVMIQGFVLASSKEKTVFLNYIEKYVVHVDNWAICDSFCNSLKIVENEKEFWFSYFGKYIESECEFRIRIGLVVFLNFYVLEEYLDRIFAFVDQIKIDKYYVNMGIAWLLCECFIQYRDKTLTYFLKSKINSFVFNKTISKIRDSYRVTKEEKEYLNRLKKKISKI